MKIKLSKTQWLRIGKKANWMKRADAPALNAVIKKFEAVQDQLSDYGAGDTEPQFFFEKLMRLAIKGEPFPQIDPRQWELYASVPGWESAANQLTAAAKEAFDSIQSAPHKEVMRLAIYYGFDS